jgi:hypothetical protein
MRRAFRIQAHVRFLGFLVAFAILSPPAAQGAALERGVAITDPLALRELDVRDHLIPGITTTGFGLGRMLDAKTLLRPQMSDEELFALPSMWSVGKALDREFDRYVTSHKANLPSETIGVGDSFDLQLFDRALLYSPQTRFVLAGIVNRMDRAYLAPDSCGEIRLIYRLTRTSPVVTGDVVTWPRLPATLNIVLKARGDHAVDADGTAITCAGIARRWLTAAESALSGVELAAKLSSKDGPLDSIKPENIDRIEINLQIAHAPKSAARDFRTDYLLKVFRLNAQTRVFEEAPMENQIDREKIFADAGLKRDFRAWLLDPKNLAELDRGTVLVPEKFVATAAIAATPVGFAPSKLQPAFGFVQADGYGNEVFGEGEVAAALKKAAQSGVVFQNIHSVAGFERRLNDVTCSGCHQTRGIGGFHFPGVDWMAEKPSNSSVVPASPHFFGDQVRRRDILAALGDGRAPDYSRGFSERPQLRGSTELAGTEYDDGWGAHCYQQKPKRADNDASFGSWTCAEGLACQPVNRSSRIGMCFVKSR